MVVRKIRELINGRLAGEQLTYSQMRPYLDLIVDDINATLHANFMPFSDIPETETLEYNYNEFPDKYIRTVVCVGVAYKWYCDDEEGISTAEALMMEYEQNKFLMERDYGPLVPYEKRASNESGFLGSSNEKTHCGNEGINPDIRYIEVAGYPGTSVTNLQIKILNGERHLIATLTDQAWGTKNIDCGIVDPMIVSFEFDTEYNVVAVLSDGTIFVVGSMVELVHAALLLKNPIKDIQYTGTQFVATYLDGHSKVLLDWVAPEEDLPGETSIFVAFENVLPPHSRDGDLFVYAEEI